MRVLCSLVALAGEGRLAGLSYYCWLAGWLVGRERRRRCCSFLLLLLFLFNFLSILRYTQKASVILLFEGDERVTQQDRQEIPCNTLIPVRKAPLLGLELNPRRREKRRTSKRGCRASPEILLKLDFCDEKEWRAKASKREEDKQTSSSGVSQLGKLETRPRSRADGVMIQMQRSNSLPGPAHPPNCTFEMLRL